MTSGDECARRSRRIGSCTIVATWRTGSAACDGCIYPAYEARVLRRMPDEPAQARRRDARRQPALGARRSGADTAQGHRAGADKIEPLLGWCEEIGVEVVTLWLLSTDNLNRPAERARARCSGSSRTPSSRSPSSSRWRLHPVGALDLLPGRRPPQRLKEAEEATRDVDGLLVNVAVGYGGRREIADAVRSLLHEHAGRGTSLEELAEILDVEHIAEHLYTKGQPDPDLVIRTSGEQRLGGFLLWQSAHSRSSTSARPTGPTSARSTSCARSAPTPSATAATARD